MTGATARSARLPAGDITPRIELGGAFVTADAWEEPRCSPTSTVGIELLEPGMHDPIIDMLGEQAPDATHGPDSSVSGIAQIGALVYDLDRALEGLAPALELLDIGPFTRSEVTHDASDLHLGEPFATKRAAAALTPTLDLVLEQPLEGDNRLFDYLRRKGEGVTYMAFAVPDYDAAVAALGTQGDKPFATGSRDGKRWSYLDTAGRPGGVVMKLIEPGLRDA